MYYYNNYYNYANYAFYYKTNIIRITERIT